MPTTVMPWASRNRTISLPISPEDPVTTATDTPPSVLR
jgi:hypothetical protein